MPAFVTDQTLFLHVPKTGGTWVTSAVLAAGIAAVAPDAPDHAAVYSEHGHALLGDVPEYGHRFRFAFVRHPLDWWRSYWGHRMREGTWWEEIEIDRVAGHDDFGEFIRRVTRHLPGYLSSIYEQFVGTPADEIDFVGRYEHLADDLCIALRLAGETFNEAALRSAAPANVNDYARFPAFYEPDLAFALARSERRAIERFYPWQLVPEHVVAPHARPAVSGRGGEVGELQRVLEEGALRLRDAKAEAIAAQRSRFRIARELDAARVTLTDERAAHAQTTHALCQLQHSRILRLSRPLRLVYYRAQQRRPAAPKPPATAAVLRRRRA
jgi:hypothetical protein